MTSDFTRLPQAKPRVGDTADRPALAPSKQAIFWDIEARQMYAADVNREWFPIHAIYSTATLSTPPTAAELDGEYGSPVDLGANFAVIIDIGGSSANVYYAVTTAVDWWIVSMTKAV